MPPLRWHQAEPGRLQAERSAMAELAVDMHWLDGLPDGGWRGRAPRWPCEGVEPRRLREFIPEDGALLEVHYGPAFPAQPPALQPLDPAPEPQERLSEDHHVNGDGTICLIGLPSDWQTEWTAADLVRKASCWAVWFALIRAGACQRMPSAGLCDCRALQECLA